MDGAVVCQNVDEKWTVDSNSSYHNLELRWFLYISMDKEGSLQTHRHKQMKCILKCLFKNNYYFHNEKK